MTAAGIEPTIWLSWDSAKTTLYRGNTWLGIFYWDGNVILSFANYNREERLRTYFNYDNFSEPSRLRISSKSKTRIGILFIFLPHSSDELTRQNRVFERLQLSSASPWPWHPWRHRRLDLDLFDAAGSAETKYQPLKIRVSDARAVITTSSWHCNWPGEIWGLPLEAPLS